MLRTLIKDIDALVKRHRRLLLGVVPVLIGAGVGCVTFGVEVVAPIIKPPPPDYQVERADLRRENDELRARIAKLESAAEAPSLQFNSVQGALGTSTHISLENKGNGIAYIQSYTWVWRGQRVLGDGAAAWDTIHNLLRLRKPLSVTGRYLERGDALRSNESFRALQLDSKSAVALKDYKRALSEISLVVCYCKDRDLKQQCWKEVLSPMGVAAPNVECEAVPDPSFFSTTKPVER